MSDKIEQEVFLRLQKAFDDCKNGLITSDDLRSKLFDEYAVLDEYQWRIIKNLRTEAPEKERELASQMADLLEAEMRRGAGTA